MQEEGILQTCKATFIHLRVQNVPVSDKLHRYHNKKSGWWIWLLLAMLLCCILVLIVIVALIPVYINSSYTLQRMAQRIAQSIVECL